MTVQPRPDIQPMCRELCGKLASCSGIDPDVAVALAKVIADKPYGMCVSAEGPSLSTAGTERCHLDYEVQAALGGMAAGMRLANGEAIPITPPLHGGTPAPLLVEARPPTLNPQLQLKGYMR